MIQKVYSYLTSIFVGRQKEAKAVLLSLIAKQHCVLIGKPGTAKSALIREVASIFDASYFEYLMTKYTTPEELFGPVDIKLLREAGEYRYITKNRLPEARIAFLDEIFKASSAILNTLLQIMNERLFFNGSQLQPVPLWSLFAASNELPDEEELEALYDRFLFRVFVDYLPPELWDRLLTRKKLKKPKYSFVKVQKLHTLMKKTKIKKKVKKLLIDFFYSLQHKYGIEVSDRRKVWCLTALAASAVFDGRKVISEKDMTVLELVVPRTKEEINDVSKCLYDIVPNLDVYEELEQLHLELESLMNYDDVSAVKEKLKDITDKLKELSEYVDDKQIIKQLEKKIAAVATWIVDNMN